MHANNCEKAMLLQQMIIEQMMIEQESDTIDSPFADQLKLRNYL